MGDISVCCSQYLSSADVASLILEFADEHDSFTPHNLRKRKGKGKVKKQVRMALDASSPEDGRAQGDNRVEENKEEENDSQKPRRFLADDWYTNSRFSPFSSLCLSLSVFLSVPFSVPSRSPV